MFGGASPTVTTGVNERDFQLINSLRQIVEDGHGEVRRSKSSLDDVGHDHVIQCRDGLGSVHCLRLLLLINNMKYIMLCRNEDDRYSSER